VFENGITLTILSSWVYWRIQLYFYSKLW